MSYINVFVSNKAKIFIKNNQLFLENDDNKVDYPLEDINAIMIENLNTTISTYSLSKFSEYGILTFICDQSHIPSGVVLPFCGHYQTLIQYESQINITKPLQKQLWQTIIKNKIANQNEVLNICGGNDDLKGLLSQVQSGDSRNVEAQASLIYFKKLFDEKFKRRDGNLINSFLNYGYSIIRGAVAREIVVSGLMTFLGVNHHNQFNQFNLADDLMEPFRPIIDLYVKIYLCDEREFSSKIKYDLFNILRYDVQLDNQKQALGHAIEMYVQSFSKSLKENKNLLKSIDIIGLEIHRYE